MIDKLVVFLAIVLGIASLVVARTRKTDFGGVLWALFGVLIFGNGVLYFILRYAF